MPRLSAADLSRAGEITSHMASYNADGPPVLSEVMEATRELLRTEKALAYVLGPNGDTSVRVEQFHLGGAMVPNSLEHFNAYLADKGVSWAGYNPLRPEPAQRNLVLTFEEVRRISGLAAVPPLMRDLYPKLGFRGCVQLRALLCDGPSLLAWVGAFQSTPFTGRQKALLKRIVPALRKRLILERQLETAGTFRAAFVSAIESMGAATFLVGAHGGLLEANAAGKAAQLRDPLVTRAALAEAVRRGVSTLFEVTRVRSRGSPDAFLLVRRAAGDALEARAHRGSLRWQLTPKQAQVLALVAEGRSNRAIAAILEIGERTVETHLTVIYERAQVEGRSEVVARLWEM